MGRLVRRVQREWQHHKNINVEEKTRADAPLRALLSPTRQRLVGEYGRSRGEIENAPAILRLKARKTLRAPMDQIGSGLSDGNPALFGVLPDHRQCVVFDVQCRTHLMSV
jgi:hypothetical protein